MSGDASDCLGSHFCLPPSLKGRSLQMTSNSSGRTSFIRLSTSQPGVKRRWRSSEKLAANMERDTGMLSPKKSGWVEGGGLNLFSFCHCTHFFSSPSVSVPQMGRTAFMCLQTYQRFVSKTVKRSKWTPDEDNQLRELVEKMRIGNFIPYTQSNHHTELWNASMSQTRCQFYVLHSLFVSQSVTSWRAGSPVS